ncbi:galactose-1-phosphate uridylyltransferase [Actinopolyspora erythraea]|uniref:Galactose-1-phosphate uridylyltransferase n=1 Tax=Actinopolyspora erythraea TaxID=414996 RepID=A0A099D3K3_9ACTN|nr:galactose-1-phosphate uridylyltransferase [Actinopolyspora erythraea]ASU77513.1 galactose-1-phosphate uridylyltransferase [Actinopolyspora erythraea]KGI80491.1 galactose-1-phosphate uridylyltransferase [Actinopolyspora erythraea]
MRRTARQLADGREIIYFDSAETAPERTAEDLRELDGAPTAPEMRRDPLTGEWIAMAAHRQSRTYKPPADLCPLCPSEPGKPSEIPEPDYEVAVFENRFPSFARPVADPAESVTGVLDTDPLVRRAPARGRCEVVCFTSEHRSAFAELSPRQARTVVDAWADRTAELAELDGVEQVFCFENRGEEIGVTLHHPHGQIYAYPFVTPRTNQLLRNAEEYRRAHGGHVLGDVLAAERSSGRRVIRESRYWTVFVPPAARWPVELMVVPNRRVPDLPALTDEERDDLAAVYLDTLRRLDRLHDRPLPYIAAWQQAPVRSGRDLSWLHLNLFSVLRSPDKLKYLAGSESGMGVWISDVTPEQVAERLRAVSGTAHPSETG